MYYRDPIYGILELPDYIEKMLQTDEMCRLRRITQSVLPNDLTHHSSMPSRCNHGIGVSHLARKVIDNNPILKEYSIILPVAGLLHDAGNPPLSHLTEPFLKLMLDLDGESFLSRFLFKQDAVNTSLSACLNKLGIGHEQILNFVTGINKPYSDILHGSLDVDNLDNIARYAKAIGIRIKYNPQKLASAFRFEAGEWILPLSMKNQAKYWQDARRDVYEYIYGYPGLNAAMMIRRALDFAYAAGLLTEDFFFLNDNSAIEYLAKLDHPRISRIIDRVIRWDWYGQVYTEEIHKPSERILEITRDVVEKKRLTDFVAEHAKIPLECMTIALIESNDRRKVVIPFVDSRGNRTFDDSDDSPKVHIRVYAHREFLHRSYPYGHMIHYFIKERQ